MTSTPQSSLRPASILSVFSARGTMTVVLRELRAASHHGITYWQRFFAGFFAFMLVFAITQAPLEFDGIGGRVFLSIHGMLAIMLAIIAPLLTADCIAREKREGTLGLLFLTPLSSRGIVIGKSVAQILRLFSLWLATLPMLTIPFAMGGVTGFDLGMAVTIEFAIAVMGLSSGLIASTLFEDRNWAFFTAAFIAACFWSIFVIFIGAIKLSSTSFQITFIDAFGSGLETIFPSECWDATNTAITNPLWKIVFGSTWGLTLLCLAFSLLWASHHVDSTWREKTGIRKIISNQMACLFLGHKPLPGHSQWLTKRILLVPLFLLCVAWTIISVFSNFDIQWPNLFFMIQVIFWGLFGLLFIATFDNPPLFARLAKHKRLKNRNPIQWLSTYSNKTKFSQYGLCLCFTILTIVMYVFEKQNNMDFQKWPFYMLLFFAGVYTIAGVSSFWREKQSGALELILITPITVNQLIWGRVRGLWIQFLPSAAILFIFFVLTAPEPSRQVNDRLFQFWVIGLAYLSLPFFATYTALRVKYFAVACILTLIGGILSVCFGYELASFNYLLHGELGITPMALMICTTIGFALFVGLIFFLLRHSLRRRIYSF